MDKVIIELLLLPRMVVYKRSPPMSKEDAEEELKVHADAINYTARIVPAEKYKKEVRATEHVESQGRGYKSNVE